MLRTTHRMLRAAIMLAVMLAAITATGSLAPVAALAPQSVFAHVLAPGRAPVARGDWAWPLRGSHDILRPFIAPSTEYSAGHRGIDIAAGANQSGLEVLAPEDGVVHFAGVVVDRGVLSVEHRGGVLSSYEPVTAVVHKGDAVHRGQVIATLDAGHCSIPCLHFGVRVDGQYVSPLLFLGGVVRPVLLPSRLGAVGSRSGMRSRVTLLQPLRRHVCVQLGGAETRVAEQFLHGAKVCPAVEQMRCRGVPERVRAGRSGSRQVAEQSGNELVNRARVDALAPCTDENGIGGRIQHFVPVALPLDNRTPRWCAERHDPLLRSLADHAHGEAVEVDVAEIEADDLAHAKGRCVQQFHDRKVACRDRLPRFCALRESLYESVDLVAGQHARQVVVGLRRPKAGTGIRGGSSSARQPSGQAARSRGSPRQRRLREAGV